MDVAAPHGANAKRCSVLLLSINAVYALDNGAGRTPPMGFNTWNHFSCTTPGPSETLMLAQGDALIKTGMAHAGYIHVNIDDCWQLANRTKPWSDPTGMQIANPARFPSGMKHLASSLHAKLTGNAKWPNLKFGVYSARCRYTCQKFAASFGHELADATQWAEWGVDYLKLDECYGGSNGSRTPGTPSRTDGSCHDLDPDPMHRLGIMRDALNASGRQIFFSNELPAAHENYPPWYPGSTDPGADGKYNATYAVETFGPQIGSHANMWRISQDIGASWKSIMNNLDFDEPWSKYAEPGSINDPDMLQVGNGPFSGQPGSDQPGALSHFALWCMLSAPLLAGNDLTQMHPYAKSVLTHEGLIAINQDALVSQAVVAKEGTAAEVALYGAAAPPFGFVGPLSGISVPFGHRRCGRCCGSDGDVSSHMCRGSDAYGTFANVSLAELAARCAADKPPCPPQGCCAAIAQDMNQCGPSCFRPVSVILGVSSTAGKPTPWSTYYKAGLGPFKPVPGPGPACKPPACKPSPPPPAPPPPPPPPPPVPGPAWQVWKKHLADGRTAALLLNRAEHSLKVTAEFSDLGIGGSADVINAWTSKSLGKLSGSYSATLPAHGSVTLLLKPSALGNREVNAYQCDSVHVKADTSRFQRRYLQLECAQGKTIRGTRFANSCARADLDAYDADDVAAVTAARGELELEKCVGRRGCRVWLGQGALRRAAVATCE